MDPAQYGLPKWDKFCKEAYEIETKKPIKKDLTLDEFDKIYPILCHNKENPLLPSYIFQGAVSSGNIPLIDHIFKKEGKSILTPNPLYKAVGCEDRMDGFLTTKKLLKLGADPNMAPEYTDTPLSCLLQRVRSSYDFQMVKLLLKHKAKTSSSLTKTQQKTIDKAQKRIDTRKRKKESFYMTWMDKDSLIHKVPLVLIKKIFKFVRI